MLDPRKLIPFFAIFAIVTLPTSSFGQILSDGDFLASNYTSSTALSSSAAGWPGPPAQSDIRYNVDYGSLDIFNDGFLIASIPEAPRSDPNDTSTTGIFLSANNDSQSAGTGVWSMAAVTPNALNVGTGTGTPNFKMTVDVFHSAGTVLLDPNGNSLDGLTSGTTNYTHVGILQSNAVVQVEDLNAPDPNTTLDGGGNLTGQGLGFMTTGDGGATEDYVPLYGGAFYSDRTAQTSTFIDTVPGVAYYGVPDPNGGSDSVAHGRSGLAGQIINQYWLDQGLGFGIDDIGDPSYDPNSGKRLSRFTANGTQFSVDPNDVDVYDLGLIDDANQPGFPWFKRVYGEAVGTSTGVPSHLSGSVFAGGNSLASQNDEGIVANKWSTHELYWVDGVFTYVIDGAPVLQIDPEYDPNDISSGNVYDDFSDAGSVVLGFFDRFNSVANEPEGGNFVIYDNLLVESVSSGAAPDLLSYYEGLGFLLTADADVNGDGRVDGLDFLQIQREDPSLIPDWEAQYGTPLTGAATSVPEPMSATLMLLGGSLAMIRRRR